MEQIKLKPAKHLLIFEVSGEGISPDKLERMASDLHTAFPELSYIFTQPSTKITALTLED